MCNGQLKGRDGVETNLEIRLHLTPALTLMLSSVFCCLTHLLILAVLVVRDAVSTDKSPVTGGPEILS